MAPLSRFKRTWLFLEGTVALWTLLPDLATGRQGSQFCLLLPSINRGVQPFVIVTYSCVGYSHRSAGTMWPAGWRLDMPTWQSRFFLDFLLSRTGIVLRPWKGICAASLNSKHAVTQWLYAEQCVPSALLSFPHTRLR